MKKNILRVFIVATILLTTESLSSVNSQLENESKPALKDDLDDGKQKAEHAIEELSTTIKTSKEALEQISNETLILSRNFLETVSTDLQDKLKLEDSYLETYEDVPEHVETCKEKKNGYQTIFDNFLDQVRNKSTALDNAVCEIIGNAQVKLDQVRSGIPGLEENLTECEEDLACYETIVNETVIFRQVIEEWMFEVNKTIFEKLNELSLVRDSRVRQFEKRIRIESNKYVSCLLKQKNLVVFEDMEEAINDVISNVEQSIKQLNGIYSEELKKSDISLLLEYKFSLRNFYNASISEIQNKENLAKYLEIPIEYECDMTATTELENSLNFYLKDFEKYHNEKFQSVYTKFDNFSSQAHQGLSIIKKLSVELNYCERLDTECITLFKELNFDIINLIPGHIKDQMTKASLAANEVIIDINSYYLENAKKAEDKATGVKSPVVACIDKVIERNRNDGIVLIPSMVFVIVLAGFSCLL